MPNGQEKSQWALLRILDSEKAQVLLKGTQNAECDVGRRQLMDDGGGRELIGCYYKFIINIGKHNHQHRSGNIH